MTAAVIALSYTPAGFLLAAGLVHWRRAHRHPWRGEACAVALICAALIAALAATLLVGAMSGGN